MKKKYVLAAMMAAAVGLTACSFGSKEGDADAGTIIEPHTIRTENADTKLSDTDAMNAASANTESANMKPADTAASLASYRQTVEESGSGMVFSLIYLDEDEIPELVAGDRGSDKYSIYTIKDSTLFCLVDSITVAELVYFEHSGIIASFASWNGGGDEGGYGWQYYRTSADKTLTDGEIPLLEFNYNAVYDQEGIYTGEGVVTYFYMGQETEESVYKGLMETLGITEGSGSLCLENAVIAEEMLGTLK